MRQVFFICGACTSIVPVAIKQGCVLLKYCCVSNKLPFLTVFVNAVSEQMNSSRTSNVVKISLNVVTIVNLVILSSWREGFRSKYSEIHPLFRGKWYQFTGNASWINQSHLLFVLKPGKQFINSKIAFGVIKIFFPLFLV